ncbi:MAG: acyltransferase [Bryobacterales bacterium]|nr:acyltransferase [Bryobacterales bacterium]MBV9399627.1 acyltransferase [Bryobacterales bacterium]
MSSSPHKTGAAPTDFQTSPMPTVPGSVAPRVSQENRLAPLDGLRGLAIVMVLLTHYGTMLDRTSPLQHIVRSLFDFGWTGVDCFFVLSGFLITGILLDTRGAENYFQAFYARRILRIFPLYYFSLILLFLLVMPHIRLGSGQPELWRKLVYIFYVQNWFHPVQLMGQYWTLAVEEQFYLIWPLVVYLFPQPRILRIAIGGSMAAVIIRLTMLALHVNSEAILENTFARMDSLLIGAACACIVRRRNWFQAVQRSANLLCLSPAVVLPAVYLVNGNFYNETPFIAGVGYTLIDLSFAALLLSLIATTGSSIPAQRFFTSRLMRAFGTYSYAAYIWHILVRVVVMNVERALHLSLPWFLNIPLLVIVTLLFSIASYAFIERPFLSLKRYFKPRMASYAG